MSFWYIGFVNSGRAGPLSFKSPILMIIYLMEICDHFNILRMQKQNSHDRKDNSFGRNLRLRSKLSLVVSHRSESRRKAGETKANLKTEAVQVEQKSPWKWTDHHSVEVGDSFHGITKDKCKKLHRKTGTLYSVHQLLELKTSQLSKCYLPESKRTCFETVEEQLRRYAINTCRNFNRKCSLPSLFGRDRRTPKLDITDRPRSDLAGQIKWVSGDLAIHPWLGLGTAVAGRCRGSLNTFSVASKSPSLPTITADDSQEEEPSEL